ncbi:MAG: hypothetical protein ACLS9G_09520, partial [Akkermansia sp.]
MNYSLHTAGHILFFIYWQFQPCTENETLVNAPLYSNKKAPPVKWRPAAPLLRISLTGIPGWPSGLQGGIRKEENMLHKYLKSIHFQHNTKTPPLSYS